MPKYKALYLLVKQVSWSSCMYIARRKSARRFESHSRHIFKRLKNYKILQIHNAITGIRTHYLEKPSDFKKIMGVKIKGNSLYFFPTKIGQKTRAFLLLFFAKYTRFVRNFLKNLFLFFFSNFYTTDTLKHLLGGPNIFGVKF